MDKLSRATEAASLAVEFDKIKDVNKAIECYRTAARYLDMYLTSSSNIPFETQGEMRNKVREYLERATTLEVQNEIIHQEDSKRMVQKCGFLLQQALDADEAEMKDIALQMYMEAVQLAIEIKTSDENVKQDMSRMARKALERAETLKGINSVMPSTSTVLQQGTCARPPIQREQSVHLKLTRGKNTYTDEEKAVLIHTSKINNNCFMPFMDIDLKEKFQYAIPFEDRDGRLKLSSKQSHEFDRWVRPDELCTEPKMIVGDTVDCYSIKQTIVSDCSFVASLAVSALYEKNFKKKIITSIIYPKNKNKEPIYNPFGKYMVKLHVNGVRRKVIIDELLPCDRYGKLLCSFSSNKNEFWVSLLEKAYMKVMGGYDFPGSNSNIDLYALTGWIPERVSLGGEGFDAGAWFARLSASARRGQLLATAATGRLPDAAAARTGLVPAHAYALLDARLVDGVQLLKLKNPWSHLRWRGNYSELDTHHWTPELRRELNYDPDSAAQYDNGVFWIDYKSILEFFDVFYLNWNPEMFEYTFSIHQKWDASTGPAKDAYNVGENPQFSLQVHGKGDVWLLLTRHITTIEDFRDNQEYITLLVYKNNGKRVYYPYDPSPYKDGVRINSPHYLCQLTADESGGTSAYTLVVSQYEKTTTIFYTLRAYGKCQFTLNKLEPYPIRKTIKGEWTQENAGGCENYRDSYPKNPKFLIAVPDGRPTCSLVLELRGPKVYQMGMDVTVESLEDPNVTAPFRKKTSGSYRSGFVMLELPNLFAGRYIVSVSTFYPGEVGAFFLEVKSTAPVTISGYKN